MRCGQVRCQWGVDKRGGRGRILTQQRRGMNKEAVASKSLREIAVKPPASDLVWRPYRTPPSPFLSRVRMARLFNDMCSQF